MEKSYYAIIPANVRYDKNLTPNAKLLYGEITALSNEQGYCWASNSYFAELYGVSKTSISKWINQLIANGYLKSIIIYRDGTKEILNRHLTIIIGGIEEKFNAPIEEKLKDNNTLINNTLLIIFSHWNSKNIIKHSALTKEIEKAIEKALKIYTESDIKHSIDVYNEIIKSEFYFSYKWSLPDFLNRKNGISTFMDEGSNKANYEEWKQKGGNSGDRSPTRSTGIPSKSFEGNKLEERPIELTEEERRELNEL